MKKFLTEINKSSMRFLEPMSLEKTYETIVLEAMRLVKADYGLMFTYHDKVLDIAYSSNNEFPNFKPRRNGMIYKIFKAQEIFYGELDELKEVHPKLLKADVKSVMFIPMSYRKKASGVIVIQFRKITRFTRHELNLFKLFGAFASIAIRKNLLQEEMKRALDLRDAFISMASHELRTPLTTINGYAQMLYRAHKDDTSIEANWIKKLYVENVRLTNLVKELMEVNRIKSGQLQYFWSMCSLNEIVSRAVETFQLNHPARRIALYSNNSSIKIIADPDKFLQLLLSILDNAEKFSPDTSVIDVILEKDKSQVSITIKDKGIGIPKKNLESIQLAQKFDKLKQNGLGIGLFLAKNIIDQHHGSIKITSRLNKGTAVKIRLPNPNF